MATISWNNSFFTDTPAAVLMKHNHYTTLHTTENYNNLLQFAVVYGMYKDNIKRQFKQHAHKQMSASDCETTCRTFPVNTSFHPKSKSSFFIDASQSLSSTVIVMQKSSVFHTMISIFSGDTVLELTDLSLAISTCQTLLRHQ
jgi:hypothetical protein